MADVAASNRGPEAQNHSTRFYLTCNRNFANESAILSENSPLNQNPVPQCDGVPSTAIASGEKQDVGPLRCTWAVWEQLQQSTGAGVMQSRDYDDKTRQFATFSTLREFWRLWEWLPQPSQIAMGNKMVRETLQDTRVQDVDALMVFKDGVKPKWEDVANTDGGHFLLSLKPGIPPAQLDEYWNNLIFAMIGGTLPHDDFITGARLVDKLNMVRGPREGGHIRIEVWIRKCEAGVSDALRQTLEEVMCTASDGHVTGLPPTVRFDYKRH